MKLKKEYLILGIVIVAAGLYLFFHKKDQTQYTLPNIAKIEIDAVTRLAITTRGETITLDKKHDRWFIAPHDYPADGAKVKGMLFEIEDIDLTDLVSESQVYARYQLDDAGKIKVKAWGGDKVLREFDVGKEAATYQHTFIRLPANPSVYHARGDFRRKFEARAADLRDQEVLAFDPDNLKTIRLTNGPETLVIRRTEAPAQTSAQASQTPAKTGDQDKPVWVTPDGREVAGGVLDGFLNAINNLKCEGYLEGRQKSEFKNPVFEIILEGKQTHTLAIFKKENEKNTVRPSVSSDNAYPFTLSDDRLENWQKTVARLAGKEAPRHEE